MFQMCYRPVYNVTFSQGRTQGFWLKLTVPRCVFFFKTGPAKQSDTSDCLNEALQMHQHFNISLAVQAKELEDIYRII